MINVYLLLDRNIEWLLRLRKGRVAVSNAVSLVTILFSATMNLSAVFQPIK